MKRLALLLAAFALTALAADVTGTWKGTAQTSMGPIERTFVFKVDGSKLTGETTAAMTGKSAIEDGKIEGDNLSFGVTISVQGFEMKLKYTGVAQQGGKQIKLHAESVDGGVKVDYTVDKVS